MAPHPAVTVTDYNQHFARPRIRCLNNVTGTGQRQYKNTAGTAPIDWKACAVLTGPSEHARPR